VAHFAKLDENNVVTQVIVVDNKDCADASGVEKEYIGAAFCERLFGGTWKQTSYNGTFRKNYAGIGLHTTLTSMRLFLLSRLIHGFLTTKPHNGKRQSQCPMTVKCIRGTKKPLLGT
jgi:hypothetical protein